MRDTKRTRQRVRVEREPGYAELRKIHLGNLRLLLRAKAILPALPLCHRWVFVESDAHRDPDGVAGAGIKLVLDALVAERILPADTAANVGRCYGYSILVRPGAGVQFWHKGTDDQTHVVWLPGRLPDLNELLHAAQLDGQRRARRRA